MNLNINFPNYKRFCLWLSVAVYTYLLQYVVISWFFLNDKIGVSSSKKISPILILFICIIFIVLFVQKKKSFKKYFIEILIIYSAITIIFLSQPQQQKLIHVPEYILLSFLVYSALKIDLNGSTIFPLTFIITSYLGFIDEILQGIHPQRYYGSTDMVINSLSALAGICIISIFENSKLIGSKNNNRFIFPFFILFTIIILTVSSTVNVFALFDEAARQSQFQDFPVYTLILDIFALLIGISALLMIYFYKNNFSNDTIVSISSVTVTMLAIPGIVILCNFNSVRFL